MNPQHAGAQDRIAQEQLHMYQGIQSQCANFPTAMPGNRPWHGGPVHHSYSLEMPPIMDGHVAYHAKALGTAILGFASRADVDHFRTSQPVDHNYAPQACHAESHVTATKHNPGPAVLGFESRAETDHLKTSQPAEHNYAPRVCHAESHGTATKHYIGPPIVDLTSRAETDHLRTFQPADRNYARRACHVKSHETATKHNTGPAILGFALRAETELLRTSQPADYNYALRACHAESHVTATKLNTGPVVLGLAARRETVHLRTSSLASISNEWVKCCGVSLTTEDRKILQSQVEWLDDTIIAAAQSLLHMQFPYIGGFQVPTLGAGFAMEPQTGEFVQILCIRNNHWICVSTVGCEPSIINVYDSLHGCIDTHTRKLVADLMQSQHKQIEVRYADVQWQSGPNDCGLFSLAFATSICFGVDPTTIAFEQRLLRSHLFDCIQSGKLSMFPERTNTRRPKPFKKEHISIYCVCRLIDDGTQMIECFSCLEWFHQSCVRVPEQFLLNKELQWKCTKCK